MAYFPISYNKKKNGDLKFEEWVNEKAAFPELKFKLSIPNTYQEVAFENQLPTLVKPVSECAFFQSPEKDIQVLVQCTPIQFEVSLFNLLEFYSRKDKSTRLDYRLVDNDSDQPDELLQLNYPDGKTWHVRRTGYKIWNGQGAFVLMVNAACDSLTYDKNADLLFAITSSFKPVEKPDYKKAEKLKIISRRYPVDFTTYIPFSWTDIHTHQEKNSVMNLVYSKKMHESMSGLFSISCLAIDPGLKNEEEVLAKVHKPYRDLGIALKDIQIKKSDDIKCFRNLLKGTVDFPQSGNGPDKHNNISFYLAKKAGSWFYMEMLGPAKETDFEAWAINDRALELASQLMVAI